MNIGLSEIDGSIRSAEIKDTIASGILNTLRDGTGICEVLRILRDSPACDHKRDFIDNPLNLIEPSTYFTNQSQSAADQDGALKPAALSTPRSFCASMEAEFYTNASWP
jgi:hypothetical protein